MTQENVTQDSDLLVVVEEEGQEPSAKADETEAGVEDTTINNEAKVADSLKGESASEVKRSSQIINQLGEDKKRLVGELIQLAKDSPQAQDKLSAMVDGDDSLSAYIRKKFGADYDQLIKKTAASTDAVDIDAIRAQERAHARADILLEQLEINKNKTVDTMAASLGLNSGEVSEFRKNVNLFSASGEDLDAALRKAAIITNSSKAMAGQRTSALPPMGGTEEVAPAGRQEVKISRGLAQIAGHYGGVQGMAKVVNKVKARTSVDPSGRAINGIMFLPDIDQ